MLLVVGVSLAQLRRFIDERMFCCLGEIIDDGRAPISAAAAFHCGWPFSHELCVVYAMIVSTTGYIIRYYFF
jgi:c-opsin